VENPNGTPRILIKKTTQNLYKAYFLTTAYHHLFPHTVFFELIRTERITPWEGIEIQSIGQASNLNAVLQEILVTALMD
jgi:hypothetical protein